MTAVRVTGFVASVFRKAMRDNYQPMARAATDAVRQARDEIITEGRANIAAAGFSERMQNALRGYVYPERASSVDAAATILHRVRWAGVFEYGPTVIAGKPYLLIPTPEAVRLCAPQKATAQRVRALGYSLFPLKGSSPPTLAINTRRLSGSRGVKRVTVPLFYSVPTVTIPDKWKITEITAAAVKRLPELYLAAFEDRIDGR